MEDKEKDKIVEKNDENVSKTTKKIKRTNTRKRIKAIQIEDDDIVTRNYDFNLLEVVIIILITGVIVSIASGFIVYNNYERLFEGKKEYDFDIDDQVDIFEDNFNRILDEYVEEVDKDELLNAALAGMYNYLGDDYSAYLDSDATQSLDEQLQGEYTGIGVQIYSLFDAEKQIYRIFVDEVFKDTPASEAGILAGDEIIELNGVSLKDKDSSYVSTTVKNSKEDTHKLKIIREGKELELTLTRKKVFIDSVTSDVIDGVGYLKIDTFSKTAATQIKKHLSDFDDSIKSIVIDVRDNSGGYLTSASEISDLFVEKDKNIYQIKDREGKIEIFKAVEDVYRKFDKIAVLINQNSASASEILALALKESANAKIVGVKSFGKGSVQETQKLSSGAMIKITTSYWLSPNGNSINEEGIVPDIEEKDIKKQVDTAVKAVK